MDTELQINSVDGMISSGLWDDALFALETKKKSQNLSTKELTHLSLVYVNLQLYENAYSILKSLDWHNYSNCAWLRRMIIAPLINSKNFIWPVKFLELILNRHPSSLPDLISISSLLIRQNKRSESCIYLEKIIFLDQENYRVVAQLIQIRLLDNDLENAVKIAKQYSYAYELNERLLHISLLCLAKAREFQFCINKMLDMDFSKQSLEPAILGAQIALKGKDYDLAEKITVLLQKSDSKDARIGLTLAKTKLAKGASEIQVIPILTDASELDPENIQINNLLGNLLLKTGNYQKALFYLEKLKDLLPTNPHTRLLNARALKFLGQYHKAANEMLEVVKLCPHSVKWKRYAASALAQAGRLDEAKQTFDEGLALRFKDLPISFEQGLQQLWTKVDKINIPAARFEWLWRIVNNKGLMKPSERVAYEKTAKWIHLLDHYLIDWLECKPDQADEVMAFFDDLKDVDALLNEQLNQGKGLILAGAHVGALFSIPLALDLLGLPHKWLASTPGISSLAYKNTLISTSDNTETEVVRLIINTLKQKNIIALAIDGAMNPAAPRVDFENQKITYSDFAAKMSYRSKAPSYFTVSYWENNCFRLKLEPLPLPLSDETIGDFCQRWSASYLSFLRSFLAKNPENARLSGGIWRHIK